MNDSTKLVKVLLLLLALSLLCAAAFVQPALSDLASADGGTVSPNDAGQTPDYGTNLWLQISSVTNGKVSLILHHTVYAQTGEVYEVWSKTNLTSPGWKIETDVWAVANQNWTPFTVPMLDGMNLFICARDWTGIDENSNGIPDWWEYEHPSGLPPVIIAQPANQTVVQGNDVTFSVGVSSNSAIPLSYQWYFNGTNIIPWATANAYTKLVAVPADAGTYDVAVTNMAGAITSSNATLTVIVPPIFTRQPTNLTVNLTSNATFSASVNSNSTIPLSYQWLWNGNVLAGATNASLTVANVQATNVGYYSVIVTNAAGTNNSMEASLTVTMLSAGLTNTSALKINGAAVYTNTADGRVLELTPAITNQAGSAFFLTRVTLTSNASFSTFFSFRMSKRGGILNGESDNITGADGIVFVVQTLTNNVGATGGGMGYYGITNSAAVEFDTWFNSGTNGNGPTFDPQLPSGQTNANGSTGDGNHVGIDYNGFITNALTVLKGITTNGYGVVYKHITNDMNDGNVWYAWIDYSGATSNLEVRLSTNSARPVTPTLTNTVNLLDYLQTSNAYLGFTAGTGSAYEQQDILTWQFISPYHPIGSANPVPSVAITSPTNNTVFLFGSPISLRATASEQDGTITNVQFFNWTTNLLGTAVVGANNTYAFAWANAQHGSNALTAVATDNDGLNSTSAVVYVIMDSPPVVNAGPNQTNIWPEGSVSLPFSASDDALPNGTLTVSWTNISGPGTVTFSSPSYTTNSAVGTTNIISATNTAVFSTNGTYVLELRADDGFVTNTSTCTITIQHNPSVAIIWPTNNAVFTFGTPVTITATAYDLDGTVTNVQFFNGINLLGTAGANGTNYTLVWTNAPLGTNTLVAVATDNNGLSKTSAPVVITVFNLATTVQIISPINQTLLARSNAIISAMATNSTAGMTISNVEFFVNSTNSLGYAIASTDGFYQRNWIPAVGGTNILTALAVDSQGSNAWSSPVTNYVRSLPSITITSPTNGQFFPLSLPLSSTDISISATASTNGTTITNVSFYQGTTTVGATNVGSPYVITWSNVTNGTYTLRAKANDDIGATGTSFPVNITVEPPNQPPSVNAGPNQTVYLPTNTVQLTGLVSDDGLPLGSTLTVTWTNLNGGTNVTFVNSNLPVTSVYFGATGAYTLRLSASDGQYTTYSTNLITVLPPDLAPTVDAGTNQTITLAAQYSVTDNVPNANSTQSTISSEGKDFWLGFPQGYTSDGYQEVYQSQYLCITSKTNTFGCVSMPGLGVFTNFSVSAGAASIVKLQEPPYPPYVQVVTNDQVENKGIHITSQDDVSVVGMCAGYASSCTYLGLPVNALGTNYIVLGWESDILYTELEGGLPSEFLIVGTAPNTTVSITPTADDIEGKRSNGIPYTIHLGEGQTYQLQSSASWEDSSRIDLSGTIIAANKPIAVFGGNELADVPAGYGWGDTLVQELIPTNNWGREFFTVPFVRTIMVGDTFQIVAAADGTSVSNNGTFMTTLTNRQVYAFELTNACHITASKPILLAQYANGAGYPYDTNYAGVNDNFPGDPLMMLVPSVAQYLSTYTISVPPFDSVPQADNDNDDADGYGGPWTNYVNIVVGNTGTNLIYLDGTNINTVLFPGIFTNIADSSFSFARLSLRTNRTNAHRLTSAVPFGVFVYGFTTNFDAYGHPGGMYFDTVANAALVSLSPEVATNEVDTTYCLIAGVTNQNSQPVASIRVDFQITGSNSLGGFAFTDENGQARFYYTGTNLGIDTIVASVGTNTAVATNIWAWPSFTLYGSVSDDGLPAGIINVSWSQIEGPSPAAFSDIHATNPVVTVTEPGCYVFQLEGDDTQLTNYDDVAVSLVRNQAPSVDAGTNQIVTGASATLYGSVTDDGLPNGTLTTDWSEVSGPGTVAFGTASQAVTAATFTVPGTYVLRLTGSDGRAAVYSDTSVTILVNPQIVQCGQTIITNLPTSGIHSITFSSNCADYYQFNGQRGQYLTVTMTSTNFNTYLAIRNNSLQLLAENPLTTNDNQIIYQLPANGIYIVEAASSEAAQTGSYAIQFECAWQFLPQITIISPPDGSFYPDVPAEVVVTATAANFSTNYFSSDPYVELDTNGVLLASDYFPTADYTHYTYDWTGVAAGSYSLTVIAYDYDNHWNWTSITSAPVVINVGWPSIVLSPPAVCPQLLPGSDTITATLEHANGNPATGNVTFTVTGANPANATVTNSGSGAPFTYAGINAGRDVITARATIDGKLAFAAVERDWTQPISCDQILSGTLTSTSSTSFQMYYTDYYSFSGSSNETVTVTMNSGNFNPYLFVLDTNCNGLMDSSGGTNGTNSQITFTLPATGDYIIAASSFFPYQTGSYAIQLECALPPQITIISPPDGCFYPNAPTNITVEAFASITNSDNYVVDLYTNGCILAGGLPHPNRATTYSWSGVSAGNYTLTAVAEGPGLSSSVTSAPVIINIGMPSIVLSPPTVCPMLLPGSDTTTATLKNAIGNPTTGNITFTVSGANPTNATMATSGSGVASFTYAGINAGCDVITATATVGGLPAFAAVERDWAQPISCDQILPGTLTNTSGASFQMGYADYYSFSGSSNETVAVTMNSENFNPYLLVLDTNCNGLMDSSGSTNGTNSQITCTLPATGSYIIEASSLLSYQTGSYSLTFQCNPPATNGTPQMAVLVNGQVVSNYSTLNFGSTNIGAQASINITITNQGTALLTVQKIGIQGHYYYLTNNFTPWIPPSNATTLILGLDTSMNGSWTGLFTLDNNDTNNNDPFVLNLAGSVNIPGTPPAIAILSPTNNAVFPYATLIPVIANASVTPGSITNVQFVLSNPLGSFLLGTAAGPTTNNLYSVNWIGFNSGANTLMAVASDNMGRVSQSAPVNVQIQPPNTNPPPVAVNDRFTVLANSANNILYPLANDHDSDGAPLKIVAVTPPGNHGTNTIINNGTAISYTPPQGVQGYPADGFSYQISDGEGGTAWGNVLVDVYASTMPVVTITNPPNDNLTVDAGTVVPVMAKVTPPENIVKVEFYIGQLKIGEVTNGVNGVYTLNWTAIMEDCNCGIVAQATDKFGQVGSSQPRIIHVQAPPGIAPVAQFDNLADTVSSVGDQTYTSPATISDGLFNLMGRAYDVDSPADIAWQLQLYTTDGMLLRDFTPRPVDGSGFHPGSVGSAAASGLLTTCDFTTVPNGVYDLVLRASGGYVVTEKSVRILLNTQLKVGQFSFSQQDLVIPVGGIPLTIIRTYNSINPDKGDFGYSWTWALNDMDVSFDETRQDTIDLDGESFSLRTGGGRDVTLTLPDGRRVTFAFRLAFLASGNGCNAYWDPPPGVHATLVPTVNNRLTILPCLSQPCFPPYWEAAGPQTSWENYDFPSFILTTQDGTQYVITRENLGEHFFLSGYDNDYYIQAAYGKPSLYQIKQRSGDTITINPNSIVYTASNNVQRKITFQRNSDGLITSITDPNSQTSGGPPAVKYEYDANQNLINIIKLADRFAGTYVTNSFTYTNANFPHYITGIIDPRGVTVARQLYDESGKLIGIIDANGKTNVFVHDLNAHTETIFDRLGNPTTYIYDSRGNVTTEIDALSHVTQNTYDDNNNVTSTTDPLGHTTSYGYDANNYRNAITNALGEVTSFNFDDYGQLRSKTDALTNTTSFDYDSAGHRTKVTDALNHSTTFSHDVYGRPTSVTNALSQLRATAGSDSSGNLQFVQEVGGLQMNFGHDANGNTTNTSFNWVNPNDTNQTQTLATITELDAANRVIRVTDPDGNSRLTIYDSDSRVTQSIDRMGNTNSYIYDALGNVIQTTYADGSVTRSVYDADNRVIYTDDRHLPGIVANGNHNIYDAAGRVIRAERLANVQIDGGVFISEGTVLSTSATAYDDAGRVLATTNALGAVTSYEYDAAGRQTAVIDALTNRTDSVYDAAGQLRFTTNALGQVTEYQYDAKGRRIATIFPDTSYTTNSYNEIGQLMFVKDQAGLETDYEYDNLGRITAVIKPQVFDPEGGTNANPRYEYDHDSYGNILAIRDPKGHQTKFTYDALGEPVSRTLPLLQTNRQSYNALGQLDTSVDFKGQSNRFVYDSFGRVATNLLYTAGSSVPSQTNVFIYDANGRLYQTIRPEGISTFQYNIDGAVTNILSPEGRISYEYDPAMGWLTRAYTINSDVRYGYDSLARLKTVSVVKRDGVPLTPWEVTTNTYTALGNLQNVYFPNGTRTVYQYDVMNHLTNEVHYKGASQVLASYQYTVASDGQRLASAEARLESGGNYSTNWITWSNDALHRLVKEASSSTIASLKLTNSYVYDLAGNRLWRTNSVRLVKTITGYTYNANDQLLVESNASASFTNSYDANGSVTNRSSASEQNVYSYNLEGRLASTAVNQQTNKYYYNQSGIRTRMEMSGSVNGTNIFLNDPQNLTGFNQVLEELPAVGATPTVTYTLGSQVIGQEKSGTVLYLMADGHGSTRLLTDSSGAVQNAFTYDGYGNLVASNASPQTVYLYSGERFDSNLRQYDLRARYYNPTVGRFGVQDQVDGTPDDPLNLHKYAYCQNNPVNMRDPSGNQGDIGSMTFAMGIGSMLETIDITHTLYEGGKLLTEATVAGESLEQIEGQPATPAVDTATIIVHGVAGHKIGWSLEYFQPQLKAAPNALNHDFYEFDWGGFSIGNALPFLVPVKSVHDMAFVHLQMAQMLVWMKGYDKMNVISHSWGTCLSYDLLNSGGIEMNDWVTMGSPLNHNISKPSWNTGKWINFYSYYDPIVYLDMYPNPGWHSPLSAIFSLPNFTLGVFNPAQVDDRMEKNMTKTYRLSLDEHSAYFKDRDVINRIKNDLQ